MKAAAPAPALETGGTTGQGAEGLIWVGVRERRRQDAPECKSYCVLGRGCKSCLVSGYCRTWLRVPGCMN